MTRTTKMVIVAAVAAAVAMPALAFARESSALSVSEITVSKAQRAPAIGQLNACRKTANQAFKTALKSARQARDASTKQARADFKTSYKAAADNKDLRKVALAARNAAIKKANSDYVAAAKAALNARGDAYKACAAAQTTTSTN